MLYRFVAINGTVEAELGFVGPPDVSDKVLVCGIFQKQPVSKAYSNWWILKLQSVVNCPAIRVQFQFSPQNALQSRPRYAKIGRTSSGRLPGVVCHRSYYSHSVLKGHSRRWWTRCILLSVGDNSMFCKFLLKVVDCFPSRGSDSREFRYEQLDKSCEGGILGFRNNKYSLLES